MSRSNGFKEDNLQRSVVDIDIMTERTFSSLHNKHYEIQDSRSILQLKQYMIYI